MMYAQIRDRYMQIANSAAYLNQKINAGMFLSLTGAAAHDRKFEIQLINRIDPRIHTLLVQPSRSGKGAAMIVGGMFAELLKLSYTQEVEITDAALVGTIDAKIEQRNREKGYSPEDPDFVNPLILGALGLYKVITFPEAKMMFKVGAHKENLLEIIQMALDSPGYVSKRLANNFPIKYKTDATIIGTTYFLDEFEEILLKQGMFQRMMIFVDQFGMEKRSQLNGAMIRRPKDLLTPEEIYPALGELSDIILEKTSSFERGFVFDKNEYGQKAFEQLEGARMKEIDARFIGKDREIMLPYTTSVVNMHHKLACVAAIFNESDSITEREVQDTQQDIATSLSCVVNDIISRVSGTKPAKIQKMIKSMLMQQPEGLSIRYIKEEIDKNYHVNQRQTNQVLRGMLTNKELTKSKDIVELSR